MYAVSNMIDEDVISFEVKMVKKSTKVTIIQNSFIFSVYICC